MGLKGYIGKRIFYSIILIWAVITVNFMIFSMMPGDPLAQFVAGQRGRIDEDRYNELRHAFGLDSPLHERYLLTISNMLTFNFGRETGSGEPVWNTVLTPLFNTIILMGSSVIISILIGIIIGVIVANKRGGLFDTFVVTGSLVGYSVPIFFIGWIMIFLFAIQLDWFPAGGTFPVEWGRNPPANILEFIAGRGIMIVLPVITLFMFSVGGWILLTRACVLETINEDYVLTARAKGLKERTVLFKHILKNASLPLITNVAIAFAFLISGAIITETLFSYNGMGLLTWHSIYPFPNLPVLSAIFYVTGLLVIVANFIADLLYGIIDPRVRYG
ncbi:MAG: ABC transporter permease [Candidatus Bathyarchaeota archaeon]|nr:ABC transporter permease [Candidatus Bathyarchaeota archaeon]MDH5495784.1 ABC transporter permease [Candidatus Bathyarchaeota archaeon]